MAENRNPGDAQDERRGFEGAPGEGRRLEGSRRRERGAEGPSGEELTGPSAPRERGGPEGAAGGGRVSPGPREERSAGGAPRDEHAGGSARREPGGDRDDERARPRQERPKGERPEEERSQEPGRPVGPEQPERRDEAASGGAAPCAGEAPGSGGASGAAGGAVTGEEFDARVEAAARSLRRQELLLALVSLVVGAGYLLAMALWGSLEFRRFLADAGVENEWLMVLWYLLFFTLGYNVVHFPVSFLRGYVVERRFRLSKQRLRRWLWSQAKKFLVSAFLLVALGELLYLFLRRYPRDWWFWAWLAYLAFAVVLNRYAARVLLPLFYRREELPDEELKDRLAALVERAGFEAKAIKRIVFGEETRRANAALAGLGSSKEILVSDTLLENLSPGEIETVVAHELGHAKGHHGLLLIAVGAVVSFCGFLSAAVALALSVDALGLGGVADVAGFPVIVLVFAVLYLVLTPALNYVSRTLEKSADRWAAHFTGAPELFTSALEKIGANNLQERTRPAYYEILFASHPSTATRVRNLRAMARGSGGESS